MLDRLGELAGLMRDKPQRVDRLCVVGFGGERGAGKLVGVAEEITATLLLGEDQRLARGQRWRRQVGLPGFRRDDRRGTRRPPLALCPKRRQRGFVALRDRRQLARHPGNNHSPVFALCLAEQPHCRVPGIVLALQHPTPVGDPWQQHPHWLAESAGEVRDRGVDRDH